MSDSISRCVAKKSNPEFVILEINSSRYAYNMSLAEVNFLVVKAVLSLNAIADAPAAGVVAAFKAVFAHLKPMFVNYIRGDESQRDCLRAIQETCTQTSLLGERLAHVVHHLYDENVFAADVLLAWNGELEEEDEPETRWVRAKMAKFIEWLEADSESDEDDDDDEDDD